MSDSVALEENVFTLGPDDGAILVRKNGVELLLPDIDLDMMLPDHLVPLMALSMIIGDEKKLQAAIEDMNKIYQEVVRTKDPNE